MIGNTLLSLLMLALYAVHPLLLEAQTVAVCPLCPSLVLVGAVTWLVFNPKIAFIWNLMCALGISA